MKDLLISFDVTYRVDSELVLLSPSYSPQRIQDGLNAKILRVERNFPVRDLPSPYDLPTPYSSPWGVVVDADQKPIALIWEAQQDASSSRYGDFKTELI